ncbi:MAG: electron transport complex subunit RsxD [Sedimenticola sp.]|uniref:Ion-translocating oxidoreductase complex subunit D n=1 Tax=Sedimenticola thiotaurini TaxID=1543721 RepID=A0A558CJF0_9GAMM|nr:electron transport complex subunit RsxD [Sedimenticola sp.]TVT48896.1 MAG: electron transport complex subunit RsxD [Sedimenticola thiotaurini]MCW8882186.1 electron transport complex subunit RsxD [Sedimenticola sp.]MCW8946002.1 electron transport complex subunit RsxD [Sedimenticola sp.]MCW8950858.1 electron transport complex subunit RsxD [Sedimenticola sp.]
MQFTTITSPHSDRPNSVSRTMLLVILALIPGAAAMIWYFGWGILINMLLASFTAVVCEAIALRLRKRPIVPVIGDFSAVLTALLFAVAVPPLLPWWLTVIGIAFAILLVKQIYGGLGYNPFNPAMAAYVLLLVSYPVQMTSWLPPEMLNEHPLTLLQSAMVIFTGTLPGGLSWDALTMATPLDSMFTQLDQSKMVSEILMSPLWGDFGGRGWEWVGNWYLLGGLFLLYKRIISWHIPVSMLGSLLFFAMLFHFLDQEAYPFGMFHIFTGGTILGAFFIATDPVSACTTKKGQLVYGACIGLMVFVIRTWGGYPDAVAFAVLLLNMAAPTIDYYTQPRTFGHQGARRD